LLAARLVACIEHVFGKSIALSTLFAGPTIEQLAAALEPQDVHETVQHSPIMREERADERAAIFPIQVQGSKRPFFFLHGDWSGGAFYCFAVAQALGADQPFYVLAPYRFDGLQRLPSFEDVAAAHIDAIRTIQPEGPYLLGGFCNGGLLAYEMARQLAAAGERVDFLALINPSQPIQFEKMRFVGTHVKKLFHLSESKQANLFLSWRHALRHVYRTLNPAGARVEDFAKLLELEPRLNVMFPSVEALYSDYVGVFSWLVSRYETGSYSGKITFYWASEEPLIERAWLPVIAAKDRKDIERHIVPGTHMSCVTEHIQDLAACLSVCLQRVQEEAVIHSHTITAARVVR
jgi:thioesterase domain-containing protein